MSEDRTTESAASTGEEAGQKRDSEVNFSAFSYIDDDPTPGELKLEMIDKQGNTFQKTYDPPDAVADKPGGKNVQTVKVSRTDRTRARGLPWTGSAPAGSFCTSLAITVVSGRILSATLQSTTA